MVVQKVNNCIDVPSSLNIRSYLANALKYATAISFHILSQFLYNRQVLNNLTDKNVIK
jgi:hypothetical protein